MHTLKLAHMPERNTASGIYHVSAAGQFFLASETILITFLLEMYFNIVKLLEL